MVDAVSRELILPAIRLDVPPRPTGQQLAALAERSAEQWTTGPSAWATAQVTRLAVAQVLAARLRPGPGHGDRALPEDPEQVTLAQLATLFRPHVALAAQAFALAVVESVNAGVPAAVDPVREGLRRAGVTGREPLRMIALGLDKLPSRARSSFWASARTSSTVTAVVDALAGGRHGAQDLSGLERSHLSRADALVLGGGRMTPVVLSPRGQDGGASWLQVPVAVTRAARSTRGGAKDPRGGARDAGRRPEGRGESGAEVGLRGEGWVEVFETALDAVASAMQQIDQGGKPRGRVSEPVEVLATRLVAAQGRTVAQVCASLRDVDPFVLEMFDHQVTTSSVPVAVPALEDDLFVQLWLPTSALAGPLFTGAADLFLGGTPDVRGQAGPLGRSGPGSREGQGGRDRDQQGGRGRPGGRGRGAGHGGQGAPGGQGQPGQPEEPGEGRRTRGEGGPSGRRRKPRPIEVPDNSPSVGPETGGEVGEQVRETPPVVPSVPVSGSPSDGTSAPDSAAPASGPADEPTLGPADGPVTAPDGTTGGTGS